MWNGSNVQSNLVNHFINVGGPLGNDLEIPLFLVYLIEEKQVSNVGIYLFLKVEFNLPVFHLLFNNCRFGIGPPSFCFITLA